MPKLFVRGEMRKTIIQRDDRFIQDIRLLEKSIGYCKRTNHVCESIVDSSLSVSSIVCVLKVHSFDAS